MKKILYLNNFEAPYRVPFYNLLGERYDLTLAFSETKEEQLNRNKNWFEQTKRNYKVIQLNSRNFFGRKICFDVKEIITNYDLVFMDMYGCPTNMYAIHILKQKKIPFVMSVDGMLPHPKESVFSKIAKRYFLNAPDIILSPSESVDECLKKYFVDNSKIVRYCFTSITNDDILNAQKLNFSKELLRKELGIKEDKIILSVGRFTYNKGYGKGYDILLNVTEKIPKNIAVLIVGDEPTEEFIKIKNDKKLNNLYYIGFKKKEELVKYYSAADVFVLLTRGDVWGLVINEAMSYGLPVITSDKCVAGLALVNDGKNGYIVSLNDENLIYDKIMNVLDGDNAYYFGNNSIEIIKDYTIENMAKCHIDVFESLLSDD